MDYIPRKTLKKQEKALFSGYLKQVFRYVPKITETALKEPGILGIDT